jgi:hypothetical protein
MAKPPKSPQTKKALDLKKQRRANHNNDKSARKWIPARKRRTHKVERDAAKSIIRREVKRGEEGLEELTSSRLNANREHEKIQTTYRTLAEHLLYQSEKRSKTKRVYSERFNFDVELESDKEFDSEDDLKRFRRTFRRRKSQIGWNNKYAIREIVAWEKAISRGAPFFTGLFKHDPSWQSKVTDLIERYRRKYPHPNSSLRALLF